MKASTFFTNGRAFMPRRAKTADKSLVESARSSHGRRQVLHCDCGTEDAARGIEAAPDLANLPLARMPLFDSQRGVDAPWLFEARTYQNAIKTWYDSMAINLRKGRPARFSSYRTMLP